MSYLIDTNVLLRFFEIEDPLNPKVVNALNTLRHSSQGSYICAQVMIEYWAVATRPVISNGLGLTCGEVQANLLRIETLFPCLPEPSDIAGRWRSIAMDNSVVGKQAHDARIAAVMLAHGIDHILTFNTADFTRYKGIVPVSPTDFVPE